MFVGHVAGAEILHQISPDTPLWVPLIGVGFPDLLWGTLVLAGIERAEIDPNSPLQKDIRFTYYPYSHSLVLTNIIALIPAAIIAAFLGIEAGIVFVVASASHWVLDTIVHLPDLPVLGFGKDRKVGFGLWRHGWAAFIVEYAILAAATLISVPSANWAGALIAGAVFHLVNINSFIGFSKSQPIKTAKGYAPLVLVGFLALALVFDWVLS
jgi:hypothetical protein